MYLNIGAFGIFLKVIFMIYPHYYAIHNHGKI